LERFCRLTLAMVSVSLRLRLGRRNGRLGENGSPSRGVCTQKRAGEPAPAGPLPCSVQLAKTTDIPMRIRLVGEKARNDWRRDALCENRIAYEPNFPYEFIRLKTRTKRAPFPTWGI